MPITIRTPAQDDLGEIFATDGRAFGFHFEEDDLERQRPVMDLTRFRVAFDNRSIVGVSGSFGLDITVPGGKTVPMGGVTWVSVLPTHRRQGLMRRLIGAVHVDIEERGEPVAGLGAAEGSIYERFGYGVATYVREVEITKHMARFRPEYVPPRGAVRFIEADDAKGHATDMWERYRRQRPGETSRSEAWWEMLFRYQAKERDGASPAFRLAHQDGYAAYRIKQKWEHGNAQSEMIVVELVATTEDAHAALWHGLLNVDLVGTVTTHRLPLDDPLPFLLENPRALRTSSVVDDVWLRPHDVGALLAARTYGTEDRLVIEVHAEPGSGETAPTRWEVEGGPDGGSARRSRRRADLVVARSALGAMYLGGVRPSVLADGRRITADSSAALRRADAFFTAHPLPFTQNHF